MRFDGPRFVRTPFEPGKHFWCQGKEPFWSLVMRRKAGVKRRLYRIRVCRSDAVRAQECPNVTKNRPLFEKSFARLSSYSGSCS